MPSAKAGSIDPLIQTRAEPDDRLASLYAAHRTRLVGLAAAITLDRTAADDVVQEAFVTVAARLATLERPEAYLHRVVVNASIAVVRRRARTRSLPLRPIESTAIPEIDEAWAVVADLPAQQRAVVVLRFWEDLTQEQIAEVLHIPLGTVKSTLHRALRALKATWPNQHEEDR